MCLLVVAVPPDGAPDDCTVRPHPSDEGRDSGGRRLPAHLTAYPTDYVPMYTLWKRLMRGESLFAERPSHWIYTREEWAMPPSPPRDRDASPRRAGPAPPAALPRCATANASASRLRRPRRLDAADPPLGR